MSREALKVLGDEFKGRKPHERRLVSSCDGDANPNAAGIYDLLADWDREKFNIFCRRLEVLILRGRLEAAIIALRNFFGSNTRSVAPKPDDHVATFLPLKIANKLDEKGYSTLSKVFGESNENLTKIPDIGDWAIRVIRSVEVAMKNETPMAVVRDSVSPELMPEFDIDWEFLLSIAPNVATDEAYSGTENINEGRKSDSVHRNVRPGARAEA